jgi:hypothetical protein
MVKIAYVGDFLNHGKSLQTHGTAIIILLSRIEEVNSVDIFCPNRNEKVEDFILPNKAIIYKIYKLNSVISLLKLLRVNWSKYESVIFNMLPTSFGEGSLSNAIGLIIPVLLSIVFKYNNIKVIYHNSVLTNDIKKLGYKSSYDRLRSYFLYKLEIFLFKHVNTFVLLNSYKKKIDQRIGKNKVNILNSRWIEAVPTLYLNNSLERDSLQTKKNNITTVLMHGAWGPQKNIEMGLYAMKKARERHGLFKTVISGGINHHFTWYKGYFNQILTENSAVVDRYIGTIEEKGILPLFLSTDLIILPYNAPGGHSGVLELALFFEVPVIAINFPEYSEQSVSQPKVKLKSYIDENDILDFLNSINRNNKTIRVKEKIEQATNNIKTLLCAQNEEDILKTSL